VDMCTKLEVGSEVELGAPFLARSVREKWGRRTGMN
jgi:hypothetical protein